MTKRPLPFNISSSLVLNSCSEWHQVYPLCWHVCSYVVVATTSCCSEPLQWSAHLVDVPVHFRVASLVHKFIASETGPQQLLLNIVNIYKAVHAAKMWLCIPVYFQVLSYGLTARIGHRHTGTPETSPQQAHILYPKSRTPPEPEWWRVNYRCIQSIEIYSTIQQNAIPPTNPKEPWLTLLSRIST
jgi:hypothetical protein